jgi:hypothetical protein
VLLLDEPSLGLAPIIIKEIFKELKRVNQEMGLTILIVEQNAKQALMLSHGPTSSRRGTSSWRDPPRNSSTTRRSRPHTSGERSAEGRGGPAGPPLSRLSPGGGSKGRGGERRCGASTWWWRRPTC